MSRTKLQSQRNVVELKADNQVLFGARLPYTRLAESVVRILRHLILQSSRIASNVKRDWFPSQAAIVAHVRSAEDFDACCTTLSVCGNRCENGNEIVAVWADALRYAA